MVQQALSGQAQQGGQGNNFFTGGEYRDLQYQNL